MGCRDVRMGRQQLDVGHMRIDVHLSDRTFFLETRAHTSD